MPEADSHQRRYLSRRARNALNAERRRLPMARIEKGYVFGGLDGEAGLLDPFEGSHQNQRTMQKPKVKSHWFGLAA